MVKVLSASRWHSAILSELDRMSKIDERRATIVELRYVAGLSPEETAEAMKVSDRGFSPN